MQLRKFFRGWLNERNRRKFKLTQEQSSKDLSKPLVKEADPIWKKIFVKKTSAFAERKIHSLKNLIYKHLGDKWTYSYIDKLQNFVKTINSRMKKITGWAPNKITNRDVPFLVALSTKSTQKFVCRPKFQIGNFVHISKADTFFLKKL